MGYYVKIATQITLNEDKKILLPVSRKNALAITEALIEAGIDAQLYFSSEPKKVV